MYLKLGIVILFVKLSYDGLCSFPCVKCPSNYENLLGSINLQVIRENISCKKFHFIPDDYSFFQAGFGFS